MPLHPGGPELTRGAEPKIRHQERTLAERLISEIKAPRRTDPVLPGQASDPADAAAHELWKADFVIRSSTGPAPAE